MKNSNKKGLDVINTINKLNLRYNEIGICDNNIYVKFAYYGTTYIVIEKENYYCFTKSGNVSNLYIDYFKRKQVSKDHRWEPLEFHVDQILQNPIAKKYKDINYCWYIPYRKFKMVAQKYHLKNPYCIAVIARQSAYDEIETNIIDYIKNLSTDDLKTLIEYPIMIDSSDSLLDVKRIITAKLKYRQRYGIWLDYDRMRKSLKHKTFPAYPELIQLAHDQIIIVYNEYQLQLKKQRLQKQEQEYEPIYNDLKYLNFENDNYVIFVAPTLYNVCEEGINLHHCVGSYINRILDKQDIILFLRHKSNPNESFLTVNLTPTLNCKQIHGMCNNNIFDLTEKENIMEFLQLWSKKFKITNIKENYGIY